MDKIMSQSRETVNQPHAVLPIRQVFLPECQSAI